MSEMSGLGVQVFGMPGAMPTIPSTTCPADRTSVSNSLLPSPHERKKAAQGQIWLPEAVAACGDHLAGAHPEVERRGDGR